ncbi:chromate efflux transporter [Neotabrizicola shimadae]|uniref:Chromate efflux transporter n=1 Tax=Neotabrizicola shimadae TaxID=2807096 RepID=A0A8G1ECF9_9RHOB|nr:chromate efflux transporter [Neotabrizicola shimadae]QYZ70615.1 chromate efflux transporter [Neotabrizicola shimadae]
MTQSLPEITRMFLRIGCLSFGGPAAQIAMMHRELVDERKWVDEKEYLSALSFCMLLPGPEAMQLATWMGWRQHGTLGGLIAGGLFVLPGALVVLALSAIYAAFGDLPLVSAAFAGVQAAVVAIVVEALLRVSKRALKGRAQWIIAVLAFLGLFLLNLPFPVIILAAGLWGWLATDRQASGPLPPAPRHAHTLTTIAIWGAVWLVPLGLLMLVERGLLAEIGLFFSKLALLTFGGAYAVLAWMAQEVVEARQWLTLPEMMAGLGLAETTPGPLILVTQFVGFMAGWHAGGLPLALAGAAVALWMTFAPCFLWIFAGAPWIARLTALPRLSGALSAITAAVVGVIANLSLWFAVHVLFSGVETLTLGPLRVIRPDVATLNPLALAIGLFAAWALLRRHWGMIPVLGLSAAAGLGQALM